MLSASAFGFQTFELSPAGIAGTAQWRQARRGAVEKSGSAARCSPAGKESEERAGPRAEPCRLNTPPKTALVSGNQTWRRKRCALPQGDPCPTRAVPP